MKKKALRCLKKMRRAGIRAWGRRKKLQINGRWAVCCFWYLCCVCPSYREQGSWQEICISKKFIYKKDLIQELYKLENERNTDDSKDRADTVWKKPVLKEGVVLFLKEGKLLFYRIRKKKNSKKLLIRTGRIHSLAILMSTLLVFIKIVYYNFY